MTNCCRVRNALLTLLTLFSLALGACIPVLPTLEPSLTALPTRTFTSAPPLPTRTNTPNALVVAANALEVRSGPGEGYENIGYKALGDVVEVLGTLLTPDEPNCKNWAQTQPSRICAEYLKEVSE
jgi:hypothetical protein